MDSTAAAVERDIAFGFDEAAELPLVQAAFPVAEDGKFSLDTSDLELCKLASGGNPTWMATCVKDIGTAFEQELPEIAQLLTDTIAANFGLAIDGVATTTFDGGNWHGNDTAWRMAVDLLKVFLYGDADGRLHPVRRRRVFCLVDGIVGGEGDGPLFPDAVPAGVVVAGAHPLAVDLAAARLMGFDPRRVRTFDVAFQRPEELGAPRPEEIVLRTPDGGAVAGAEWLDPAWAPPVRPFRPHPGWVGHLEARGNGGPPRRPGLAEAGR